MLAVLAVLAVRVDGQCGGQPAGDGPGGTKKYHLGALTGIVTGVGVGAAAGAVRAVVLRLGPVLGPLLLGASAMTATDASLTRLGLTDPRQWDAAAWLSDAVPHLAFGVAAYATLRATARR